jgi:hypothetical protein
VGTQQNLSNVYSLDIYVNYLINFFDKEYLATEIYGQTNLEFDKQDCTLFLLIECVLFNACKHNL